MRFTFYWFLVLWVGLTCMPGNTLAQQRTTSSATLRIKTSKKTFRCQIKLSHTASAVNIKKSTIKCTPKKPTKQKASNVKMTVKGYSFLLNVNINPSKITKAKITGKPTTTTKKPTTTTRQTTTTTSTTTTSTTTTTTPTATPSTTTTEATTVNMSTLPPLTNFNGTEEFNTSMDCTCGQANRRKRIVNGEEVQINELPWQAGLVWSSYSYTWCGGTLISDQWVMTAAHCTVGKDSDDIQVLLGEHDYYDNTETTTLRMNVTSIINHQSYDSSTVDYDFALLKLSEPVDFNEYPHIRPACLPQSSDYDYAGYESIISGWGTTSSGGQTSNVLLAANVTIMSNEECRSTQYSYGNKITDQMLCAAANGTDTCQGDSGGPLVVANPDLYELVGVVSWGYGCAAEYAPGVYARVTTVLDWIQSKSEESWNTCERIPNENFTIPPADPPGQSTLMPPVTIDPPFNGTSPPPMENCSCGQAKRNTRIVNGEEVQVNELPWQAGLVWSSGYYTWCGGTLISDQWVMTAAHCTIYKEAYDIQILLGEHDYLDDYETTTLRMNVASIINHGSYDSQTVDYDFALLRLSEPVDFIEYPHIRPACLPQSSNNNYAGYESIISGWGTNSSGGHTSNVLVAAAVTIMSNEECRSTQYNYGSSITAQMMCASAPGTDSCQGDSGGPLVVANPDLYELVGVVSWGYGCADAYAPGVYARVTNILSWIQSNTAGSWNTCGRFPDINSTYTPPNIQTTYVPPYTEVTIPQYNGTIMPPYNGTVMPPYNGTVMPPFNETSTPPSNDYCLLNDAMIPFNSYMLRPAKCEFIYCFESWNGLPSLYVYPAYDGSSTQCCVSFDGYSLYKDDSVYSDDGFTNYICSKGTWTLDANITAPTNGQQIFPYK